MIACCGWPSAVFLIRPQRQRATLVAQSTKRFAEGFRDPDLKEATAMLDAL
jgi:hypothetical protein